MSNDEDDDGDDDDDRASFGNDRSVRPTCWNKTCEGHCTQSGSCCGLALTDAEVQWKLKQRRKRQAEHVKQKGKTKRSTAEPNLVYRTININVKQTEKSKCTPTRAIPEGNAFHNRKP